ncbi:MAG: outer membrane lipoprotein-sorting protein [Candidatus Methylacidiphilales bacterium]|nr:outer membrane lipoprotein-sorting protein [Candidatus Methylacidiphilales bacterium]
MPFEIVPRQIFSFLIVLATGAMLMLLPSVASAAPDPGTASKLPPPEVMQSRMWKVLRNSKFELTGSLETSGGKSIPVIITARGADMVYSFPKNNLELQLRITDSGSTLRRRTSPSEAWKDVPNSERNTPIFGSDILYADLVMDFLLWDETKPVGTDTIKTVPCYAYDARIPGNIKTDIASVRYWVSSEHSAVIRADAMNSKGEIIRRVEINGVSYIDKTPVMKEMLISTLIPGRDLSSSRSWIKVSHSKILQ